MPCAFQATDVWCLAVSLASENRLCQIMSFSKGCQDLPRHKSSESCSLDLEVGLHSGLRTKANIFPDTKRGSVRPYDACLDHKESGGMMDSR